MGKVPSNYPLLNVKASAKWSGCNGVNTNRPFTHELRMNSWETGVQRWVNLSAMQHKTGYKPYEMFTHIKDTLYTLGEGWHIDRACRRQDVTQKVCSGHMVDAGWVYKLGLTDSFWGGINIVFFKTHQLHYSPKYYSGTDIIFFLLFFVSWLRFSSPFVCMIWCTFFAW